jgi:hypothetical protein
MTVTQAWELRQLLLKEHKRSSVELSIIQEVFLGTYDRHGLPMVLEDLEFRKIHG